MFREIIRSGGLLFETIDEEDYKETHLIVGDHLVNPHHG